MMRVLMRINMVMRGLVINDSCNYGDWSVFRSQNLDERVIVGLSVLAHFTVVKVLAD
jgi:hypothetical protein